MREGRPPEEDRKEMDAVDKVSNSLFLMSKLINGRLVLPSNIIRDSPSYCLPSSLAGILTSDLFDKELLLHRYVKTAA